MDIELIYFNFISYFYAKLGCGPTIYDLNLNNESFYCRANCKYMYILPSGAKKKTNCIYSRHTVEHTHLWSGANYRFIEPYNEF